MESQAIYHDQNGSKISKTFSKNQKYFGFYSSGNVFVGYDVKKDATKYSAKLGLMHTAKNNRNVPFGLYLENDDYGKLELGSDKSAAQKMQISGYNVTCAVGNGWDMFAKTSRNPDLYGYVNSFGNFLDSKARIKNKTEFARKITYFTPKINIGADTNLQLGLSYVPDSTNTGNGDVYDSRVHSLVSASKYSFEVQDGFSYGVKLSTKNDTTRASLAFTGEKGHVKAYDKRTRTRSPIKFHDLNNYLIGGEISYDKVAFAISYGNYNKSLTSRLVDKLGLETYIYGTGIKYADKKYSIALNHLYSNHKKNILLAESLSVEYNVTYGIKWYSQLTIYQTKGRIVDNNNIMKFEKINGNLLVSGIKISI
jgi:hypothetical protein